MSDNRLWQGTCPPDELDDSPPTPANGVVHCAFSTKGRTRDLRPRERYNVVEVFSWGRSVSLSGLTTESRAWDVFRRAIDQTDRRVEVRETVMTGMTILLAYRGAMPEEREGG